MGGHPCKTRTRARTPSFSNGRAGQTSDMLRCHSISGTDFLFPNHLVWLQCRHIQNTFISISKHPRTFDCLRASLPIDHRQSNLFVQIFPLPSRLISKGIRMISSRAPVPSVACHPLLCALTWFDSKAPLITHVPTTSPYYWSQ